MPARQLVQERLRARRADAAGSGPSAGDPVAAVVAQPGHEDRHVVGDAVAGGADDAGAVDHPAAADGDPRRGQRGDLGPARSAAAGARRSRSAARERRHARRTSSRRRATAMSVTAGGFLDTPEPAAGRHARVAGEDRGGSRPDGARRAASAATAAARSCGSSARTSPTWSRASRRRSATPSSTTGPACC